jgi:hypothetical protein
MTMTQRKDDYRETARELVHILKTEFPELTIDKILQGLEELKKEMPRAVVVP